MAKTSDKIKKIETKEVNEVKKEQPEISKEEIKSYISEEVRKETSELFKNYHREILKPKKRKIVKLRIIILLLILLYVLTFIFLLKDHYFDKYIIKIEEKFVAKENVKKEDEKNDKKEEEIKKKEEEKQEQEKEKQAKEKEEKLNNLKQKYKNIFENVIITTNNNYKNDYYSGKFSNSFYLSLGIELLSNEDIVKEQDVITLSANKLQEKVKLITNQQITDETFTYKDVTFRYIKSLNTYVLDKDLVKDGIVIEREIINIEEGNTIQIDTIEYYVKEGKKYNPITDEIIIEGSINNNKFMTHEFVSSNDKYYLTK